jgi:hypothetical protein
MSDDEISVDGYDDMDMAALAEVTTTVGLLATTDAAVWAAEFVRIFAGCTVWDAETLGTPAADLHLDEGTMVAWFANAIEVGRDAGRNSWQQAEASDNTVFLFRERLTTGQAEEIVARFAERGLRPLLISGDVTMRDDHHLIELRQDGWTIAHPIRERLDLDTLFDCQAYWRDGDIGVYGRFQLLHEDEYDNWVLGERCG